MFTKKREPMSAAEVQPTWEKLVKQERSLRRNRRLCTILQPVGTILFAFNLLLVTANFLLFLGGDLMGGYFAKMPILPSLVKSFPRESWGGILVFSFCFAYLIPLAVCGAITGVFWLLDRKKYKDVSEPLNGSDIDCAKALTNKAETVYVLRSQFPRWSIYLETGILTAALALPIIFTLLQFTQGEDPAVLELALTCLGLLLCLFVMFWIYALLLKAFSLLNSLFYLSSGEWKLYEQYQRLDAYWESIDPDEFARRQQKAMERKKSRRRKRSALPANEEAE